MLQNTHGKLTASKLFPLKFDSNLVFWSDFSISFFEIFVIHFLVRSFLTAFSVTTFRLFWISWIAPTISSRISCLFLSRSIFRSAWYVCEVQQIILAISRREWFDYILIFWQLPKMMESVFLWSQILILVSFCQDRTLFCSISHNDLIFAYRVRWGRSSKIERCFHRMKQFSRFYISPWKTSANDGQCRYRTGAERWINLPYFLKTDCRTAVSTPAHLHRISNTLRSVYIVSEYDDVSNREIYQNQKIFASINVDISRLSANWRSLRHLS